MAVHAKELHCVGSILKPLCCLLCRALPCPAMFLCSLDIYYCSTADASAAVSMLQQLPRLRGVKLGIQAYDGTEEDYNYPNLEDGYDWVLPPAMAGVAALTELDLVGCTSLPPDWRQLSALQRLKARVYENDFESDFVGSGPLTALTALTRLQVGDDGVLPGGTARPALPWFC